MMHSQLSPCRLPVATPLRKQGNAASARGARVAAHPTRGAPTAPAPISAPHAAAHSTSHQHDLKIEDAHSVKLSRRVALQASVALLAAVTASPSKAVQNGADLEIPRIDSFEVEDFDAEHGWTELSSGLLFRIQKVGEGDRAKGIFDKVDHFQPFPFVTVTYTAYTPNGRGFASSIAQRRPYVYQAGVRQEIQDEDGAVMSMVVGERRQFAVPPEISFKRKLFGNSVPQGQELLLVEVELLGLQPY